MEPCNTPVLPAVRVAECLLLASPSPPASTPNNFTLSSPMKGWKVPMALLPPPTQATT